MPQPHPKPSARKLRFKSLEERIAYMERLRGRVRQLSEEWDHARAADWQYGMRFYAAAIKEVRELIEQVEQL